MSIDFDEGLYVFEVTLGYMVDDSEQMTVPFVITADETEEAEELVIEHLELMQLSSRFWVVEVAGPYDPDEYHNLVSEGEKERWDLLEDYSEEDFLEILRSDDL